MPRFLIMNRDEFLAEILEEQKKKDVPVHERVGEYLAYEAACFLLNGPEKEAGAEDKIHTTAADELVKKLKTLGIMEYAKKCYTKVSQHVRPHYEYFLNQVMDRIVLDGFLSPNQVAERKAQLKTKLQTIRPNYADFWEENTKKPELAEPYKHRDRFTYEYEADQDSWKLFVAGNRLLGRSAGYPVSDQEVASVKKSATSQLLMRNKRTVEKLKRGELEEVKEEMLKLRRSFKFANRDTLGRAQADTIPLLEEMKIYHSGVAASNEWRQLLKAVEAFNQENDPVKAIDLSANVLVAVEKFTKGKKSKQSNLLTQTCVDLALRALSDCVPDAKNNPSVKPLIDRFNTVRGRHLFQDAVELEEHYLSAAGPEDQELFVNVKKPKDVLNPEINQPQVILNKESNRTKIVPDKKYKLEDSDLIAKNLLKRPDKQGELQNGENRPPRVVPLNIEAPKEMSGSVIPEEKEDAAHYVPVSQVSGPAHDFYQTVKNRGVLEKNKVVDALATMVAVQELKFTDIYAEDEEYTVKVDEQLFQKRQAELKKDKLIAEIADGLLMNNGQHAKQLIIASEQSARGTAREEDMSKDAEENARIYVNRMYHMLQNKYQQDAPEEDVKEEDVSAKSEKTDNNQVENQDGQDGPQKGPNPLSSY